MNYIDDKELTKLLMKEIQERKDGKRKGPSNELTEKFLLIYNKILTRNNFSGYTNAWKNEFYDKATMKFMRNWYKFNPKKIQANYKKGQYIGPVKGAHTFFTTIVFSSIFDVIRKNKKMEKMLDKIKSLYDDELKRELNQH